MSSNGDGFITGPAAKVTISPVGDASKGNDVLIVTIKTVDSAVLSPTEASHSFRSFSKSRSLSSKQIAREQFKKRTMSESSARKPPRVSQGSHTASTTSEQTTPCLRHAAENISRKASDIPSDKISLCSSCSKSMLSYIFVVQDFLDSLSKEICGNSELKRCLQCEREKLRDSLSSTYDDVTDKNEFSRRDKKSENRLSSNVSEYQKVEGSKLDGSGQSSTRKTSKSKNSRKREEGSKTAARSVAQQTQQIDFLYNVSPSSKGIRNNSSETHPRDRNLQTDNVNVIPSYECSRSIPSQSQHSEHSSQETVHSQVTAEDKRGDQTQHQEYHKQNPHGQNDHYSSPSSSETYHTHPSELPSSNSGASSNIHEEHHNNYLPVQSPQSNQEPVFPQDHSQQSPKEFPGAHPPPSLFDENVDGIMSTLSNVESEVYDSARNRAGWETLTEVQEKLGSSSSGQMKTEAFVTSCRNNAEAMGCLVLGTSLLLSRTSRTLCVLVSDGVSQAFRGPLSAIFNVIQYVRSLDSLGTTKLALLEQPDLGISFDKLNVWRLSQFSKCLYLNPDSLVTQNCDELFHHEELSAVPDIGWPDCFNSGVFVFVPSIDTFWQLVDFAEKQGSFDGGDQGLLNSYFSSWPHDISKKLSFIYNLMANVSYTYTPAFRQFGRNVKIVQFHGSFKPWHVKFYSGTGQIAPASTVHPTYVQFVHIWLNIFRVSVLRLLSQDIQSYAASEKVICAIELLRFFPLPSESEAEFYLTPPSVRLRLAERRLQRTTTPFIEVQRRKSAEFPRTTKPETEDEDLSSQPKNNAESEVLKKDEAASETEAAEASEETGIAKEKIPVKIKDGNSIPGAEVGDYQGMKAWEQGRMDYQGSDSSENIIKRLEFLMTKNK